MTPLSRPVVVTYEDRPEAFAGVELLARSLAHHAPQLEFICYSPAPEIARRLADLPRARWRETHDLAGRGWNVKPAILLRALEDHDQVLWLDTDIVVTGDLAATLARFAPEDLLVGQEYHVKGKRGGHIRAEAHGLVAARALPFHPNSGSVRVTRQHRPLLEAWSALLGADEYQAAQRLPVSARPQTHVGDQDLLWALLASEGFADLPVSYLRTGPDMLQHCGANGYHLRDRLAVLRGARPAFVHMLGHYKPWSFAEAPSPRRQRAAYMHFVCYELSPVFAAARPYAAALGHPAWLRRRSWPARLLNLISFGNVALQGLPLATAAHVATWVRLLRR